MMDVTTCVTRAEEPPLPAPALLLLAAPDVPPVAGREPAGPAEPVLAMVVVVAQTVVLVAGLGSVLVVEVDDVLLVDVLEVLEVLLVLVVDVLDVEVVELPTPQPDGGAPPGGANPLAGGAAAVVAVGVVAVGVAFWLAPCAPAPVRPAVDDPLVDAPAPVVATEVWPSMRWSTWMTLLSTTEPFTVSSVASAPDVTATAL